MEQDILTRLRTKFNDFYQYFLNTPTEFPELYIPSHFKHINENFDSTGSESSNIFGEVEKFIKSENKSLLILGESGIGKTSLALYIGNCLQLKQDDLETTKWVPIYIYLPNPGVIDHPQQCSEINCQQILSKNVEVSNIVNILLLLDGYDDLSSKPKLNIDIDGNCKINFKCITFSRPDAFLNAGERRKLFAYRIWEGQRSLEKSSLELKLLQFSSSQIDEYINQFVKYLLSINEETISSIKNRTIPRDLWLMTKKNTTNSDLDWESDSSIFQRFLTSKFPELRSLCSNPFILDLTLHILPGIVQKAQDLCIDEIERFVFTEVGIYDEFTSQWFSFQKDKILFTQHPPELYQLHEDLKSSEPKILELYFTVYSINLAGYIVKKYDGKNLAGNVSEDQSLQLSLGIPNNPEQLETLQQFHQKLLKIENLSEEEKAKRKEVIRSLRRSSLLRVTEANSVNEFAFLHPSLVEYFASKNIFKDLISKFHYYLREKIDSSSVDCSAFNINSDSIETLPKNVLKFLLDIVRTDKRFQELLETIIISSTEAKHICQMSTNAISLLNLAGISLSGKNYRNIQAQNAILKNAVISSTDFSFANLEGAKFHNSVFGYTRFNGANLKHCDFGQSPAIIHRHPQYVNPKELMCYTREQNGTLCSYLVTQYEKTHNFVRNNLPVLGSESITNIDFDPIKSCKKGDCALKVQANLYQYLICQYSDGNWLGFVNGNRHIYLWNDKGEEIIEDRICNYNTLIKWNEASTYKVFRRGNKKDVLEDLPHGFPKETELSYLFWNIAKYNIFIVYSANKTPGYTIFCHKESKFQICNFQIESLLSSSSECFCEYLEGNRIEDEYGLLAVTRKLSDDKQSISIISLPDFEVLLEISMETESQTTFRFAPNLEYLVYSFGSKKPCGFKVFNLTSLEHGQFETYPEEYQDYGDYMFCFNQESTYLASSYPKPLSPILIWSLKHKALLTKISNFSVVQRGSTNTKLFTFISETQLAYHTDCRFCKIHIIDIKEQIQNENNILSPIQESLETMDSISFLIQITRFSVDNSYLGIANNRQIKIYNMFKISCGRSTLQAIVKLDNTKQLLDFQFNRICGKQYILIFTGQNNYHLNTTTNATVLLVEMGDKETESAVVFCKFLDLSPEIDYYPCFSRSNNFMYFYHQTPRNQIVVNKCEIVPDNDIKVEIVRIIKTVDISQLLEDDRIIHRNTVADQKGVFICFQLGSRIIIVTTTLAKTSGTEENPIVFRFVICAALEPEAVLGGIQHAEINFEQSTNILLVLFCSRSKLYSRSVQFHQQGETFKFNNAKHLSKTVDIPLTNEQTYIHKFDYSDFRYLPHLELLALVSPVSDFKIIDPKTLETCLEFKLNYIGDLIFHLEYTNDHKEKDTFNIYVYDNKRHICCVNIFKDFISGRWMWKILWKNLPSVNLVAFNSNFDKSYNMSPRNKLVVEQLNGIANELIIEKSDERRKYTGIADLVQPIESEDCFAQMEPILVGGSMRFKIKENQWAVSVLQKNHPIRNLNIDRECHTSLVIEGMVNCRRFICKAELTFVSPCPGSKEQVVICANSFTFQDLVNIKTANTNTYKCKTFIIPDFQGKQLLRSIQNDQILDISYDRLKNNCVRWCKSKLKEIGIQLPKSFLDIVITTPLNWQLTERNVVVPSW